MNTPKMRAVVENGKVVAKNIMYLNFTYDNRFANEYELSKMLDKIADTLKKPELMLK